ncbi:MAG TPA: polysaccharide pyruvyl transferase family protein [bacterium]|nr:polysaccharide pyruvyl transferase family protein [bacterium]
MKKTFAMIGAFARYNYGDLLFPVLAAKAFEDLRDDYDFVCYGLAESDLSRYGAEKTRPIREWIGKTDIADDSVLFVAGGDVLGINWVPMHMHRLGHVSAVLFSLFFTVFGKRLGLGLTINRMLARRYGAGSLLLPWIVPRKAIRARVRILYNAVGGSALESLIGPYPAYIRDHMNEADYISVRDRETRNRLVQLGVEKEIFCVPDSAVTMSVHFPLPRLRGMVNPGLLKKLEEWEYQYLCFQINYQTGTRHFETLITQLNRITLTLNLHILLLPVGLVPMHDDQIVLRRLRETLAVSCHLPETLSIHEIMYCIARSRLFIGTSLHGAVTALSYAVPHLGLTEDVPKLRTFLRDWDIGPSREGTAIGRMAEHAEAVSRIDRKALAENRHRLIGLVHDNYRRMCEVLAGPVHERGNRPVKGGG